MKKKFAADFRKARDDAKMSREEFATVLGVSATSVQKWEDAEVFPLPKRWDVIFKKTGINPQGYKEYSQPKCQTIAEMAEAAMAVQVMEMHGDGASINQSRTGEIIQKAPANPEIKPHELKFIMDMRRYGNVDMWERFWAEIESKKN